jgi:hypothetical protein
MRAMRRWSTTCQIKTRISRSKSHCLKGKPP